MRRRLVALALLLAPGPARAHEPGLSRGEYRVDGALLTTELVFARRELAVGLVAGADADADGQLGEFELLAVDAELRRALLAGIAVAAGPDACAGAITRIVFVEEDGLQVDLRHTCPRAPIAALTLRWPLLARLGPGHRHLGRLVFASPEGHVPEDIPEIDFVAHARRSALTIRRPDPRPRTSAAPAPPVPAAPPPTPPVPAASARWPWLAGLALALTGALALRARRRRQAR